MPLLKPYALAFLAGFLAMNVTILVTSPFFDDPAQGLASSLFWVALALVVAVAVFVLVFQKLRVRPMGVGVWIGALALTAVTSSIGIALIVLGYTSPSEGGAVTVVLTAIIGFLLVRRGA